MCNVWDMKLKYSAFIGISTYVYLWFSSVEAACFQDRDKVIPMCESKTITGSTLYIEANTTVQGNELCSCTATSSRTGEVGIFAVVGTTFSDCSVRVDVYERMSSQDSNIYSIHCLQDASYSRSMAANTEVMYNLTGPGTIDSCVMMRTFATGSTITITCSPKIQVATTIAPPTTPAPTTQAATTPAPTTQAPTTQRPTQSPRPTTQPPVKQSPTTQAPTTQAPTSHAATRATPTSSTPVVGSTQSPYDEFPVGWVIGVIGLFIIVLVLSIVMWFKRHALCRKNVKQETEQSQVYSTFQVPSDENEYQSLDISQSASDRVYYNVPETLAI
ncbi:mucin-5AC-like [Haliotis rufescens]|uniref:mucin-5AC-like n=1 Tax=Haliotis rufescens TaxID=6454 RepID=UPI00201E8518|nr:mucin-5AC-like [Haliotis rufescens]